MRAIDMCFGILIGFIIALMLGGFISHRENKSNVTNQGSGIRIVEYDGHQYLYYEYGDGGGLCHLESCTNNTHVTKR